MDDRSSAEDEQMQNLPSRRIPLRDDASATRQTVREPEKAEAA
jgi:hypothetical protein